MMCATLSKSSKNQRVVSFSLLLFPCATRVAMSLIGGLLVAWILLGGCGAEKWEHPADMRYKKDTNCLF